jgi:hypothetical protein
MTGTERKRAWRARQKAVNATAPEERRVSTFVVDYPAAMASIRKSLRTEVRLKHSLAADQELATLRPKVEEILKQFGLRAMLPTLDEVKAMLGLTPEEVSAVWARQARRRR